MTTSAHARISEVGNVFSSGELTMTAIIFVFGTLLVVSSAYAADQIAPVVGFFGTIAGYLLGRSDRRDNPEG